ncbi:hypothetical protein [Peribacillus sp. R9-11]|uniref:hypothetical protein n=1 Tax=Peribacillus sp. R9-11 TaxID=3073271 RepID=UPI0028697382|nr:hypothetical protein [Peribacillus sp. R9-11]WMX58594.1 hypothetical protein RE409_29285 [Peribacillus sp. R9-11]
MNNKIDMIHLPDLSFIQFCHDQFGINRGVYNTIDAWFFHEGIRNILERREQIYHFLTEWVQDDATQSNGKIKIGHGNLSKKLKEYFESAFSTDSCSSDDDFILTLSKSLYQRCLIN